MHFTKAAWLFFWLGIFCIACGQPVRTSSLATTPSSADSDHVFAFDSLNFRVVSRDGKALAHIPFYYVINVAPVWLQGSNESVKPTADGPRENNVTKRLIGETATDGSLQLRQARFSSASSQLDPHLELFSTGVVSFCAQDGGTAELWDFRDATMTTHPCQLSVAQGDKAANPTLSCMASVTEAQWEKSLAAAKAACL